MSIRSFISGKTVPLSELQHLKKTYEELLQRKEKQIEQLKKENQLILKQALKQTEKRIQVSDLSKQLVRINKELKDKLHD